MMIKFVDCAFRDGSYPCGYKDGDKLPDCELCHKIRKAGLKEVVGFLTDNNFIIWLTDEEEDMWQTKLKEWGIK